MKNHNPKLSVIVPVFRVEQYIEKAIGSILQQQYCNYEVIIIDDGSDDDSILLAESLVQKHGNFSFYKKKNRGLASARNMGLKYACGEYVLFLDSDDWFLGDFFGKLDALLTQYQPDILFFNGLKGGLTDLENMRNIQMDSQPMTGIAYIDSCIRNKEWISVVWLGVYRREFLNEYQIRFIEGIIHEDDSFILQCLHFAKQTRYFNEKWYRYRIRAFSIMKSKNAMQDYNGFLSAAEISIGILKNHLDSDGMKWLVGRYLFSTIKYLFQLPYKQQVIEKNRMKSFVNTIPNYKKLPYMESIVDILGSENVQPEEAYQLWFEYIKNYST